MCALPLSSTVPGLDTRDLRFVRQDARMPDVPESLRRLDAIYSTALIAHEAIYALRRQLVAAGRGGRQPDELLRESARLALTVLPELMTPARQLATRWHEQSLLDPDAAEVTAQEIAVELDRVDRELDALLQRQRQIAARLREQLEM